MRIVVVSLARAQERRSRMVERLEALDVDNDIHDATDWRDLTPAQEAAAHASMRRDGLDYWKAGIATTISQRAVLAAQVANGPAVQCMLEDDVGLSPELPAVLAAPRVRAAPERHPGSMARLGAAFPHGSAGRRHHARRASRLRPSARTLLASPPADLLRAALGAQPTGNAA